MNEEQRIKVLEEELKILKNELKTVLLDLREQYLNIQNPFNFNMSPNVGGPQPGVNPKKETKNVKTPAENGKTDLDNASEDLDSVDSSFESPTHVEIPDYSPSLSMDDDLIDNHFAANDLQFAELETSAMSEPSADNDFPGSRPSPDNYSERENRNERESRIAPDNYNESAPRTAPDNYVEDDDSDEESVENIVPLKAPKGKNNKKKEINLPTGNPKFDLVVIAGLTQWIDQATAKLGKERTEALVEMSCTMGRTPEHLKEVLIKMARLSPHESNGQPLKASDYLSILAQLENLLGESEIKDHALLSILSMMKESPNG